MKRFMSMLICAALALHIAASPAHADVNVTRSGDENPMKEVAKSVLYGGMAGLALGGAIAWAGDNNNNDGDIVRWGFVGGTFLGLGMGLWWVTKRPSPTAVLELKDGSLRTQLPSPDLGADGRPRVTLARVTF